MLGLLKKLYLVILSVGIISSCTYDKSADPQPGSTNDTPNDSIIVCDSMIVCDSIIIICDSLAPYTCDTTFVNCNTVNICDTLTACDTANVTYSADIEPIISAKCAIGSCHVPGGFALGDFTTYAGLKAKVDTGITGTVRDRVIDGNPSSMPPSGVLPQDEIFKIDCWLKDGAPNN